MNVNQLIIKSVVNAMQGNYSLMVVKKDGSWGDCANVNYGKPDVFDELKKSAKIIEREDLKLNIMTVSDGNLLIGLEEV